jgi:hypothetical protein
MTNHYETDYLDELFGSGAEECEPESVRLAREIAEMRAEKAAREQEKAKNRCPRCMGHGRISCFSYNKGGECFQCGGTGIFYRG